MNNLSNDNNLYLDALISSSTEFKFFKKDSFSPLDLEIQNLISIRELKR